MFSLLQLARLLEFTLSVAAITTTDATIDPKEFVRIGAEADRIEQLLLTQIQQHTLAQKKARQRHVKKHAGQNGAAPVTTKST